jgi:hypothetical protein
MRTRGNKRQVVLRETILTIDQDRPSAVACATPSAIKRWRI